MDQLAIHKAELRKGANDRLIETKTAFQSALQDYSTWEQLSPRDFEVAVAMKLQKNGLKVQATRYSKDGGVDVEATDESGCPVIVQTKRYKNNVGVSVVREMIGVRESRPDKPRTIIYSLVGFTKGARQLAQESEIELRDVRSDLLRV
jgi:HJR/Mrr/RecB family endonuclease